MVKCLGKKINKGYRTVVFDVRGIVLVSCVKGAEASGQEWEKDMEEGMGLSRQDFIWRKRSRHRVVVCE